MPINQQHGSLTAKLVQARMPICHAAVNDLTIPAL